MANFRFDRAVSVNLFQPACRLSIRSDRAYIPILMYHSICDRTATRHPYYETITSPRAFAKQMKYLCDNGYQAIDLEGAVRSLELGEARGRHVVITFDDGYRDFYTDAHPILCEYGFTATVFILTGHTGDHRLRFKESDCLTWSEVRELHSKGIRIGSHTVSHPKLKLLSKASVVHEISRSKQTIEDKLGHPVKSFSYPFAFPEGERVFASFLEETLVSHGYQNGVSTIIGRASSHSDRFFLPRLPVNMFDDMQLFQAKLEGCYDWLHSVQWISKKFGHVVERIHTLAGRKGSPDEELSS